MQRFGRHLVVGLAATGVNYVVFSGIMYLTLGRITFVAAMAGYLLGTVVAFVGNYIWVHVSTNGIPSSFVRFCLAYGLLGTLNSTLIWLLVDLVHLDRSISFVTATAFIAAASFFINRHMVFGARKKT